MKEELVSFKISKLAKEVGFNEPCREAYGINEDVKDVHYMWRRFYTTNQDIDSTEIETREIRKELFPDEIYEPDFVCTAPTQSLLQRWLRDVHNIDITIITNYKDKQPIKTKTYRVGIIYIENNLIECFFIRPVDTKFSFIEFNTYEQALEAGLEKTLNIIKEHN